MTASAGLRDRVLALVARSAGLPVTDIDADRPLQEIGLSSRDAVTLAAELSGIAGRPLAPTLVWEHPTVSALVAALSGAAGAPARAPLAPQTGPVAVLGMGCRLPGGIDSPAAFWRFLDAGGDGVGEVPEGRWANSGPGTDGVPRRGAFLDDVAGFDAAFFGITPREAATMDPQQRLVLEVAWSALEHAGIPPAELRGTRTGVYVGLSSTEFGHLTMTDLDAVDAWSGSGAAASVAANRLSYLLDLRGPSLTIDTACSSSLVAVHHAVQALGRGEIDTALVAGVNLLLTPGITGSFARAGVLAADGHCKPFAADADGIVRGEGCGVVVLRSLRTARRRGDRVLALIAGSAVNSDGRSNGLTAPNPEAQADLLRDAYAVAGQDPAAVDYVEAHGTGTPLGDPIEAGALHAVLGKDRDPDRPLLIGSVKSNLGHLEGAAGIVGLIKVVLGLTRRRLPASLHAERPHPQLAGLGVAVVTAGRDWPRYSGAAVAGVSAFGFGGTNAHVVLEEWPAASFPVRAEPLSGAEVFALSARTPSALATRAGQLAEWLDADDQPLRAVAATLAHRREHLPVRAAVVADDRAGLGDALRALARGDAADGLVTGVAAAADVVLVFSGYGSQWPGMGRRLLAVEPAFAAAVDELEPAFLAEAGFSLRDVLLGERDLPDLGATQLVLFGMQVALAALWRAHGVVPAAVLGHSMGEVAAAVVAGALDVADGLRVMATRARLLAGVDASGAGAMAVVELPADELSRFPGVEVAVYGSPAQCTVTGPAEQVDALVAHAEGEGRLARRLPVRGAGHSVAVEPLLPGFRADLAGLTPRAPTVPCYSTVHDDPRRTPAFDVEHWAANLRRPVRFTQAVAAAVEDGHRLFVEVAPHPVALAAIEQTAGDRAVALPTSSKRADEHTTFLTSLAQLHVRGIPGMLAGRGPASTPVELPGPVWEHVRHWPDLPARTPGAHPLLGVHVEVPGGERHLWQGEVGTTAHPWLADHGARGVALFPGTGFLELALAAAHAVLPAGSLRIEELGLHRTLVLDPRTTLTTGLIVGAGPGEPATIEVHGRTARGEWMRHATARARSGAPAPAPLGPVRGEPVDLYGLLAARGQTYGPAFRGLGTVHAVPGRASATLRPIDRRGGFRLHPALADACLHALAAATGDAAGAGPGLFLPLTIGAVTLAGDPCAGVRVDAALDSVDASGDGLLGTVQLVDAAGAVLVEFRDVYCRRIRPAALPVPLAELTFTAPWQRHDLPGHDQPAGPRRIVVLEDPRCAAEGPAPLVASLAAGPGDVETVDVVPADDPRALAGVLAAAGDRPITDVVLLAGAATAGAPDPGRARDGLLTLSRVVATLVERPARLWVVTDGGAAVTPGEPGTPDLAALRGPVRVLAFEHPELRASLVDLHHGADPAQLAAEVLADAADDEIAWRAGERYVRRLARPELPEPGDEPVVGPGAYVLSGGLGGLGRVAARWLAGRGATRLVLGGRRLQDLDDLPGVDVRQVAGDIAAPGVAERLVAAATEGGVPLRGVLHAAGVLADGVLAGLDPDAVADVWQAKAAGAWRLHEASADHDLDWWLTYSSAAALFGSPGQGAYAGANAWTDALVDWRRAHGLPAATIQWGAWGQVGAVAGSANPVLDPLGTEEALDALDAVLRSGRAATGVARVDAAAVHELFPALARRPFFGLLAPPAADRAEGWDGLDALRAGDPAAARAAVTDRLATVVAGLMGHADVDRHVPLTDLGLDSLLAMRARGAVERDLGLPLPVPLLLRGASLAEIGAHLAEQAGFGSTDVEPRAALLGPRDPAERWVARHWRALHGGPDPDVHADLVAAGGDVGQLRAAFVAELGDVPDDLFAVPTVAGLADVLRPAIEGGDGVLLRVLRAGTGVPLFLFHPAGGPTSVYGRLVELLPREQAVYGFERLDDERTVEGRAARYVELLREVAPHGPYRLGGWSFGGCLAYECARLLTAAGETVDVVVLIDTILPLPAPPGRAVDELLLERFGRFAEHIEQVYGARLHIPPDAFAGLDEDEQITRVMELLGEQVPGMGHGVLQHQYTSYVDARVAERYVPQPYDGDVLLLRAKESHQVTTTLDPRYRREDDALGWDRLCRALEIVRVPGDHVSMIDPPHVAVLAGELAERLER